MTGRFAASLCASTAAIALTQGTAFAQDRQVESVVQSGIADIIVTADRRDTSLQEVPVSVTAIDSELLELRNTETIADLTTYAPNVKFDAATGGATLKPYIRGGGITDGTQITSESNVSVYVDNVYRARLSGASLEFLELERVEVLRGPQGVLYGRNSSSGAVKLITRGPSETLEGKLELGYGIWNEVKLKGRISGPLDEQGQWRAGISGMYSTRDGGRWYNSTLDKKLGAQDFLGFQGDIAFESGGFEARLSATYTDYDSDGQYSTATVPTSDLNDPDTIVPTSGDYDVVVTPVEGYVRINQFSSTLNMSLELGAVTLTSITGYAQTDDRWREDFSGGVRGSAIGLPSDDFVALYDLTSDTDHQQFSQELDLSGSLLDDRLDFIVGLYYFNENGTQTGYNVTFFAPSNLLFDINTDSYAAFGQLDFEVLPGLTLIAGGRYTRDDKSIDSVINTGSVRLDDTFEKFTPKFGARFELNRDVQFYATYSEGFKAGGYNGLVTNVTALQAVFRPEITKAYELGMKGTFFDRKLRLNIALFQNNVKDLQQLVTLEGGNYAIENYDARARGIEIESVFQPVNGLTFWGNVSINDGTYTSGESEIGGTASVEGNDLASFPDLQFTLGTDVRRPLGPGEIAFGGDYAYRGKFYASASSAAISFVESLETVNAYIAYRLDNWDFRLSGKNLFDAQGWQTGLAFSVVRPRWSIEPRTWMASASLRF